WPTVRASTCLPWYGATSSGEANLAARPLRQNAAVISGMSVATSCSSAGPANGRIAIDNVGGSTVAVVCGVALVVSYTHAAAAIKKTATRRPAPGPANRGL